MAKCSVIIPSDRSAHAFEHVGDRTSTRACLKLAAQTTKRTGKWVRVVKTARGGEPGYGYAGSIASCIPRTRKGRKIADCQLGKGVKQRLKRRR